MADRIRFGIRAQLIGKPSIGSELAHLASESAGRPSGPVAIDLMAPPAVGLIDALSRGYILVINLATKTANVFGD